MEGNDKHTFPNSWDCMFGRHVVMLDHTYYLKISILHHIQVHYVYISKYSYHGGSLNGQMVSITAYRPWGPEFESRVEQFLITRFPVFINVKLSPGCQERKTLQEIPSPIQVFCDISVYVNVNSGEVNKSGTADLISTNLSGVSWRAK